MRAIKYIVVHATGGREEQTIADLNVVFKQKGWKNPGYHYVIKRDGGIVQLLDVAKVSNGVKNYNQNSIHVAYIGGIDKKLNTIDNRTEKQKVALRMLLKKLNKDYPGAMICGHRDLDSGKDCPCFNVSKEL